MEYEGDIDTNYSCGSWNGLEESWKETERTVVQRKNQDQPDNNNGKILLNTWKCSGDLKKMTVIKTSVKNHKLELVWKAWKVLYNNQLSMIINASYLSAQNSCFRFYTIVLNMNQKNIDYTM